MNIYFICTGNTCRSPLAEALLNHENMPDVTAKSAGIHAMEGLPISVHSAQLLAEAGITHKETSNELTPEDMQWADLVLTMTWGHRDYLHSRYPEMKENIFTLKEYVGAPGGPDVHDPFGGSLDTYRTTFKELEELIQAVIQRVTEEKE